MTYTGVCLLKVMLTSTPCWLGAGVPLSQVGTGPPPAPHTPTTWPQHGCYRSTTVKGLSPGSPAGAQGGQGEGSRKGSSRPSTKLSIKPSGRTTAWDGGGLPRPEMAAWALSQPGPKPSDQGGPMGRAASSGRGKPAAGWVLPQPCFPLVPSPSVLLLDCWSLHFAFQLFLVTTDLWPWTHQTSTQNKSLFQVDSVSFPVQPLQVEALSLGTQLPYSPRLQSRRGR